MGAVYVYTRAGTTWTEQKLAATSYRDLGTSVGISGDTICSGAVRDGGSPGAFRGAAFLFNRTGGTWTQQQIVTATDPATEAAFGTSCAVEGDTLIVGAPGRGSPTSPAGAAYVFNRAGGSWTFAQKLGTINSFGQSLDLSGSWLAVGAPYRNGPGSLVAFERVGGTWTERQSTRPNFGFGSDQLGASIAFDGTTIVVGAPPLNSAYFFARGSAGTGAPGAPASFTAGVSGNAVTMAWNAPATGGAPTGYRVVARTAGGQLLTTLNVGTARSVTVTAPNGSYRVSVLATNAAGAGPESNSVTIAVPVAGSLPGAPSGLTATVIGTAVSFTWNAPAGGGSTTGYVLRAGTSPSFTTPIATLPLPASPLATTVNGVPPGTYWVRVQAGNATGVGPASNEVMVTVAGPQAPGAPTLNAATVVNRTVSLSWVPGPGAAATRYAMTAAATPGGPAVASASLTGTSASFSNVPPGTYYVRLVGVNAAGASPVSNEITVVVP